MLEFFSVILFTNTTCLLRPNYLFGLYSSPFRRYLDSCQERDGNALSGHERDRILRS